MPAVRRLPVTAYFGLTFAISWGAILGIFGVGPIAAEDLESRGAFLYLALLMGPSIAGLVSIGMASGKAGFAELGRGLIAWRVAPRWYAFAILAAPLTLASVLLALSAVPGMVPDVFTTHDLGTRLGTGMAAGLAVALCEETGWTGFAVPRLRNRFSVLFTGTIVGIVWGAWHFPPFWKSETFAHPIAFGLLLARLFTWLPAFRVLLVWMHEQTRSLLLVILMHASLVASQFVFVAPFTFTGSGAVIYILLWAGVLWAVAGTIITRSRPQNLPAGSSEAP